MIKVEKLIAPVIITLVKYLSSFNVDVIPLLIVLLANKIFPWGLNASLKG